MFCWHRWGKWSAPTKGIFSPSDGSIGYFSVCQLRECEKCGLAEYRRLPQMRSADGIADEVLAKRKA